MSASTFAAPGRVPVNTHLRLATPGDVVEEISVSSSRAVISISIVVQLVLQGHHGGSGMYGIGDGSVRNWLAIGSEGRILLAERSSGTDRKPPPVTLVDVVLDAVEREIAVGLSPWSGVLLGPLGSPIITEFGRGRGNADARDDLEIKGVLRMRPPADRPNGSAEAAEGGGELGPWPAGTAVSSIVTRQYRRPERHELLLPSGIMSVYVSEPGTGDELDTRPAAVYVLPIGRDLDRLVKGLGGTASGLHTVDVEGTVFVAAALRFNTFELRLLFSPTYPFQAPTVLIQTGSSVVAMPITWDLNTPERSRLESAVRRAHGG
ncbi:hypothetical protein ACFXHA_03335 [Nocardia sp. NPDC059240]|uniref:hypothetical protein n=1 Tax=Nocardia sp. NPDC059240 TaxID=3346786 RepID=UPI0036B9810B